MDTFNMNGRTDICKNREMKTIKQTDCYERVGSSVFDRGTRAYPQGTD